MNGYSLFNKKSIDYGSIRPDSSDDDILNDAHDIQPTLLRERQSSGGSSLRDLNLESLSHGGLSHISVRDVKGTATMPSMMLSLIKNLVGAGMLSLPAGVAKFANAPSAVIPGLLFDLAMGAVFGYYFWLIGRTCRMSACATYRECWEETVGSRFGFWVSLVNVLKPGLGNLAYSMILADTFTSLFETLGWNLTRSESLLIITILVLLPLCLLKSLEILAPTSLLGSFAMFATAVAMGIRYFDGSYEEDGQFYGSTPPDLQPSFGNIGALGALNPRSLILVCMFYEAFIAHYNAPRFQVELKNSTDSRYGQVVAWSFGVSAIIYFFVMTFGFLTFGANADGFILNNYSTTDNLATFCRMCLAVAITCTYPVTFVGVRDGTLDLLRVPMDKHTGGLLNILSVALLSIVTICASIFTDLGALNAVGGAIFGTAIVFVFPAIMFREAVIHTPALHLETESQFALGLMWVGIILGAIGVYFSIVKE